MNRLLPALAILLILVLPVPGPVGASTTDWETIPTEAGPVQDLLHRRGSKTGLMTNVIGTPPSLPPKCDHSVP